MPHSSSRSCVDPCFSIDIGPAHRIVELSLHGLWSADTYLRCRQTLTTMLASHPPTCPDPRVFLFDLRDFPVQPQPVVTALAAMLRGDGEGPGRSAIVAHSALLKSQLRRVVPNHQIFVEREHALAWLTGTTAAQAA